MAASSAPGVKAALLTLLQADAGLTGVGITYAHPGVVTQEDIFYNRTIATEQPDTIGQRKQREEYDIEVVVTVARDGNDAKAAEDRCWALVARVENVVRANNGANGALPAALGTGVAGAITMGGGDMTPYIEGGQRISEWLGRVHVWAIK